MEALQKQDLIVYIALLLNPIGYALLLVMIIMQKAINFSDFNIVLVISIFGALITYLLSIPYIVSAMKEHTERSTVIIRLAIYHVPALIAFAYSFVVVLTSVN